jgi:hypothetical protein
MDGHRWRFTGGYVCDCDCEVTRDGDPVNPSESVAAEATTDPSANDEQVERG